MACQPTNPFTGQFLEVLPERAGAELDAADAA